MERLKQIKHEENTTCIANKTGMYKWGGKERCRLLFRIYSTPDFIPRNTPTVSLRSIQGKGCIPLQKRLGCLRGTAGGFQRNGRVACVDFGRRLDAGSGTVAYRYSERESCGYPPVMCGKKRGAHVGGLAYRWIPSECPATA